MRNYIPFLTIILLVISGCSPSSTKAPDTDRYVVILSMDGFRWDLTNYAETPTLDSIRRMGTYTETYPCFPANTFPNHYAMATGLHPDNHGIIGNQFYDSRLGKKYSMSNIESVRDPEFWKGEPIWNTAERQGLLANIFMWVGSETVINERQATVWTPYSGEPSFFERADWVADALHREKDSIPNLIMWYFEEPDIQEHRHGPVSPETKAIVEHIDTVLAYFLERVKTSPVYDKINFIFTSDHGFCALSQDRYINIYGLLDDSKMEYAITSTPLYLEPQEDYTQSALEILRGQEHVKVFHRDSLPEHYNYGSDKDRIPQIIVLPENGWIVDYREEDKPKEGGGHGFDPFSEDMKMVFYAMGPDFKAGAEVESFQNLNIYNILCYLLAIEPSPNDGDPQVIKNLFGK